MMKKILLQFSAILLAYSQLSTTTTALVIPGIALRSPSTLETKSTSITRLYSTKPVAVSEIPRGGAGGGGGDATVAVGKSGGTATIPNEVFNLVKSIVGAGVLSLPAGKWAVPLQ